MIKDVDGELDDNIKFTISVVQGRPNFMLSNGNFGNPKRYRSYRVIPSRYTFLQQLNGVATFCFANSLIYINNPAVF